MDYLDHTATTLLDPRVAAVMEEVRATLPGNPGSVHQMGQRARVRLDTDRESIAREFGAEQREIVFTSGGTEANNLALKGWAWKIFRESCSWPAVVTARTEHHAVLHPVEWLASLGAEVRYLEVDRAGRADPARLADFLATLSTPHIVSLMHANNEIGSLNPVVDLAAITREQGGVFHTDCVQTFGKLAIAPVAERADMISVAGHKIGGPRGVGALYIDREHEVDPLIHGGSQERDRRAGTEPVDLIAGFAEAVRIAAEEREERHARLTGLRDELRGLLSEVEGVVFITPEEEVLPTIVNISFDDAEQLDGEGLIVGMDIRGVALSNGSACTSGSIQPSHVLLAAGYPESVASTAIRFSLGASTTREELGRAVVALREVLATMRGL